MTADQTIQYLIALIFILLIILFVYRMMSVDRVKSAEYNYEKLKHDFEKETREKERFMADAKYYNNRVTELERQYLYQSYPYATPIEQQMAKYEADIHEYKLAHKHNAKLIENLKRTIALMNEKSFEGRSDLIQEILELREELGRKLEQER